MIRLTTAVLALGVFAAPALAQEAMQRGPQHERLAYFVGDWQFEGRAMDSPMGPGGPLSGTDDCEWFEGRFHVVCHGEANTPRGRMKTGSVWGYDPLVQKYTLYGFNSSGEAFYVLGTVDGKVWTWNAEYPMGEQVMHLKATVTEESSTAYRYRLEMSPDGTNWTVMEQGRGMKKTGM